MTDPSRRRRRPPYDPELEVALSGLQDLVPSTITPEMIPGLRVPADEALLDKTLASHGAERHDTVIPGHLGDDIVVSVIAAPDRTGHGPGFLHLHAGGMVMGTRFDGIDPLIGWALRHHGVLVTVEYRLAPEFPDPYLVEDSYAALTWLDAHANELGVDQSQLIVHGASAGGGLAAGVSLLARDRHGPRLAGQLLAYPMLDDRGSTPSTGLFEGIGVWDQTSNVTGWSALLGSRRGSDDVSIYAAPARAGDLAGLPPTYIDVGSAEVFRDECIAFASSIWAAGGEAQLQVWPGAFHACDLLAPDATISQQMLSARHAWVDRLLIR